MTASKSKIDNSFETSIPGASLESILCTEELHCRPNRAPDHEKENRALVALAIALADSRQTILQTLAETILKVTASDSSGVSLLTTDDGGKRFYWPAIAGMWKPHIGGGTPRDFGPCGDVLDRNCTLLFKHFERRYTYFLPITPAIEECLLVPFYVGGKAVGTIWAIMHSDRRKFDAEDERLMSVLGQFASLAYQTLASIEDLQLQMAAREKAEAVVRELANGLETQVRVRTQELERRTRDLLDTNEALEREIAERKRAKKALQVRELNLHLLVDSIAAPVAVMTPSGEVETVNKPNLEYFGKTLEDLKKWGTSDAVHPDDLPHAIEIWMEAIQTGQPYNVKERLRRFDGVYRWFEVRGFPLRGPDGRILNWCVLLTDIDDRQRAEEALRASEAYSAEAQRLSHTGSWHWNVGNGEVAWSEEYCAIFGFDFEKDKPSYQLFIDRVHPEDRPNVERVLWADVREKRDYDGEYRLLLPDGSIKYLHSLGKCSIDQSGDVEYIGAVVDVTEHKRAEQELRDSEERHRVVVEAASDAVISMDENGAILLANAAALRVFGYDPTELIGKPLTLLMPEYMRKLHEKGFKGYLATGERHINWQGTELTGLRKNGQEFPVEISFGELVKNGRRIFTGFIRDISERKRAEEALRRSESYLAEAQRLTHIGSWAGNILTREIFHSSDEHSRLYGLDPESGIPSFETLYQRVHPEDQVGLVKAFERASHDGIDVNVHYRIVLPDGTTKHVQAVGHPVLKPSGEAGEFVGFLMDVTERKRAEEERERLRQAQADLAHINRVSTMGELTASLAHEIKQPIAAATTDAKTCLRWLGRDEPDVGEAREAASRLIKDVSRASDIIGRIGSLFKKSVPNRELVDVNDVIQEMIALLRGEAVRHSISIHGDLASDLPKTMADRVQLQQVLMNLMLNGIEAMKDMGTPGELTIKSEQDENRRIIVAIADTGVGLRPDQTEQVFNAFFTSKPQGTGMGLSISRSIVESHGGRLWASPNSGSGATFQFTLPIEVAAHEAA